VRGRPQVLCCSGQILREQKVVQQPLGLRRGAGAETRCRCDGPENDRALHRSDRGPASNGDLTLARVRMLRVCGAACVLPRRTDQDRHCSPCARTSREGAAPPVVIGVADLLKREHRGPVLLRLAPHPAGSWANGDAPPLKMGELLIRLRSCGDTTTRDLASLSFPSLVPKTADESEPNRRKADPDGVPALG